MGELLALTQRRLRGAILRVTASYTAGKLRTPKSGMGRAVPLLDEVATTLTRLAHHPNWIGPDDLVFVGTPASTSTGSQAVGGIWSVAGSDAFDDRATYLTGVKDIGAPSRWHGG